MAWTKNGCFLSISAGKVMDIISIEFAVFCLAVLVIYAWLSRAAQNPWLLLASYIFYASFGWQYLLFLLVLTWFNFWVGNQLAQSGSGRKWLGPGIAVNAALLVMLKLISGSFGEQFGGIWQTGEPFTASTWLPVGFSFYVLQAIAYLIGISRGQSKPATHWVDFALYMAYFPKLLAGPIERPNNFLPQLEKERMVDNDRFGVGVGLILLGLLRKMVIADGLRAIRPVDLFIDPAKYPGPELIFWLVVFAFELYNDFAGYSNLVRGISNLFGIELSVNFSRPFFARSFGDFWNRWHISFSSWLRDYIFFPLRRWFLQNKFPSWMTLAFPPLLTMLFSGFWHGASFAMLLWGVLHGLYQIAEQLYRERHPRQPGLLSAWLVFGWVTLAWILFGAGDLTRAILFTQQVGNFAITNLTVNILVAAGIPVALSFLLDSLEARSPSRLFFMKWQPGFQAFGIILVLSLLLLITGNSPNLSNFVYQGF
jgi:D-alanyl-lipoteichoic acid acyltransferase DltB (MBOAT superfamily)